MKYILLLLLVSSACYGQDSSLLIHDTSYWKRNGRLAIVNGTTYSLRIKPEPTMFMIFGHDMSKGEAFRIMPNGDLFYSPSLLCDCKKCKRKKGLVFYRNLFTGNSSKP